MSDDPHGHGVKVGEIDPAAYQRWVKIKAKQQAEQTIEHNKEFARAHPEVASLTRGRKRG